MTSVAMPSRRSSGAPSAPAKARDEVHLGPKSHSAVAFLVDDEDLDDRRTAQGICLGLRLGLGSWVVIGFAGWLLA
jgi:hypothetical protein